MAQGELSLDNKGLMTDMKSPEEYGTLNARGAQSGAMVSPEGLEK